MRIQTESDNISTLIPSLVCRSFRPELDAERFDGVHMKGHTLSTDLFNVAMQINDITECFIKKGDSNTNSSTLKLILAASTKERGI